MSAQPAERIVTKGEFARLRGVSAARVSQWLSEGKIDAAALVGEGRAAQIRVDVANAQLRARLDTNQRFGLNGLGTNLTDEAAGARLPLNPPGQAASLDAQIQEAKLRDLQLRVREKTEAELARRGVYVRADETSAAMTRVAAKMLAVFEGGLNDIASKLAAEHGLDRREVVHTVRTAWRGIRAKAAESARREAEGLAPLIEDAVPDATDPAAGEA